MPQKANTSLVTLAVLLVISSSLAGTGLYFLQRERVKSAVLEERLQDLNSQKQELKLKIQESEKLVSSLQLKLQEAKLEAEKIKKALESAEKEKEESKAQIEQLKLDLEIQKNSRTDTEKKLTQAQDDLKKQDAQLKILESRKVELEAKLKELEAKSHEVELGRIVVNPQAQLVDSGASGAPFDNETQEETLSAKPLEGKVLAINRDYNFAVINLGSNDGLGQGDIFFVYHANKYIGEVKLEKVNDAMSAAVFVSIDLRDKISQDDKVVQKVK